jgi:hypothetical protein
MPNLQNLYTIMRLFEFIKSVVGRVVAHSILFAKKRRITYIETWHKLGTLCPPLSGAPKRLKIKTLDLTLFSPRIDKISPVPPPTDSFLAVPPPTTSFPVAPHSASAFSTAIPPTASSALICLASNIRYHTKD